MDTETPVLETAGFDVYLIDTTEHCVKITSRLDAATGVIVAEKR
jgi:2-C-methyl-D-erythritol 4-phosphate cytidylyltransferase